MKGFKRGIAAVTAAIMTIGVAELAQAPNQVYADAGDPGMVIGSSVLAKNAGQDGLQRIWYGEYGDHHGYIEGSHDWYVIGCDGAGNSVAARKGFVTLLHKGIGIHDKFYPTYSADYANNYSYSTARKVINSLYDEARGYNWVWNSPAEKAAIAERTLEGGSANEGADGYDPNKIKGESVTDHFWLLSVAEANELPVSVRHEGSGNMKWWLRSPGYYNGYAACVINDNGTNAVDQIGELTENKNGLRPACDIDMNSIVFTSAATGGKVSGEGADALTAVAPNTSDEWKLTIKDTARDAFTAEINSLDYDALRLEVSYTGATAGENEYVSAIVADESGTVKYYGHVAAVTNAELSSGTVAINLKNKYAEGDKVYIFSEHCNSDKTTDYSSGLINLEIPALKKVNLYVNVRCNVISSNETARKGQTVSLQVVPNEYHVLAEVHVLKRGLMETVELTPDDDVPLLYTFTMPDTDVYILAMCKEVGGNNGEEPDADRSEFFPGTWANRDDGKNLMFVSKNEAGGFDVRVIVPTGEREVTDFSFTCAYDGALEPNVLEFEASKKTVTLMDENGDVASAEVTDAGGGTLIYRDGSFSLRLEESGGEEPIMFDKLNSDFEIKTAVTGAGGEIITSDKTRAYPGEYVIFKTAPAEGYATKNASVLDKDGKEVNVTRLGSNAFGFHMPEGDVEIHATFADKGTSGAEGNTGGNAQGNSGGATAKSTSGGSASSGSKAVVSTVSSSVGAKTGDANFTGLWAGLAAAAVGTVAIAAVARRRRRKE